MIERPTDRWRREHAEEEAEVAAGPLGPDEAYAGELWPDGFVAAVDRLRVDRRVARLVTGTNRSRGLGGYALTDERSDW